MILTIAGTLFCIGVALFIDSHNFHNLTEAELRRAVMVNILVPVILAGPLLFLSLFKMRQLAIAHRELQIIASTDSLTAVLNRGAFTMLVDECLRQARRRAELRIGAFFVVDADHFKRVNDSLGHQNGDRALRAIAETIKECLRRGDLGWKDWGRRVRRLSAWGKSATGPCGSRADQIERQPP